MTNLTRAVEAVESRLKVSPTDATDALRNAWPFLEAYFEEEQERRFQEEFDMFKSDRRIYNV